MTMALTLKQTLESNHIDYDLSAHGYTDSALMTAQVAHISGDKVAKSVVLTDEQGYMLAIVPASHRIDFKALGEQTGRYMHLATELEIGALFSDCQLGSIPPVGIAYGIDTIVDDTLDDADEVFFESGDHRRLVHVQGKDFRKLLAGYRHGHISQHL